MENTALGQFAIAAAAVLLAVHIVKAVLPLLAKRNGGEHPQLDRQMLNDVLSASVIPILQQQTSILSRLEALATGEESAHLHLQHTTEEIRSGQDHVRQSLHKLNDRLQAIVTQIRLPRNDT